MEKEKMNFIPTLLMSPLKPSFCLTILALFSSCATSPTVVPSSDLEYQKDLEISSDRSHFSGIGVLPKERVYHLQFQSRKEAEIVRVSNCHRDIVFRDIDDKKFSYTYAPNELVEDGSCILQVSFLDKKGFHQFGAISFIDSETLPASLSCNGSYYDAEGGASTCQAKAGTLQGIEFSSVMEVRGTEGCKLPTSDDGEFWQYSVKEGYCLFLFKTKEGEYHRLTTFGYNEFMKQ